MSTPPSLDSPDFQALTQRQRDTWSAGNFHEISRQNMNMAEDLVRAADPRPSHRVLDLACGSGTAALVAARRYCPTVGLDLVPSLLDRARARAQAAGLAVEFREGDAQDLPFEDDAFDVILSVYGVQFAPNQERAAAEMLRVCRPGGTIALATPLPHGWSGDFFRLHGRYLPSAPGTHPPLRWGTDEGLEALLGSGTASLESEDRPTLMYYRSVDHAVEVFSTYFGPTILASHELGAEGRETLAQELHQIFERHNQAEDGNGVILNRFRLTLATVS